ncbi:MAG TPA: glycosyltransferase [Terriglobia bacterium]|nr:glycosyltransferase [Terriglobia bacterium]
MRPVVSAIITTCGRPHLLKRAIHSVLSQTLRDLEVIIVVDGPDTATMDALATIRDDRLRVHVQETRGGQSAAINKGVTLVSSPWIALLDDDDEWMPEKLATQLACANASNAELVVGCRFVARSEKGDTRWPLRIPKFNEHVGDYMFCRSRLDFGEGILPTSVLFAPSSLFRVHRMNETLKKHCDLDWLIRVDASGVRCAVPDTPEPLAIWHMQADRERMSNVHDWRFSYEWITSLRPLITSRAYAGFLLTWASLSAREQADYSAVWVLLREAFRAGRPGLRELAIYCAVWTIPAGLRRRVSRRLTDISFSKEMQ